MLKKFAAVILAVAVLFAAIPMSFASTDTELPTEVTGLDFVIGDTLIDQDFESVDTIPDGYELRNPTWDGWPGNKGTMSLSTYTVNGATDKGLQLNTQADDVILIPTLPTVNYVYEADITLTANSSGSLGILNDMSTLVRAADADSQGNSGNYGANRMVIYAPGHSSAGTKVYYHTKFGGAGSQQNLDKPTALAGHPTIGETLNFKVYTWNGTNYFYINDIFIASFANVKNFGPENVVGIFASSSSIFISKLSVKALTVKPEEEGPEIIGTSGNKTMYKGESLLAYDFTQSELADGTLPEGFTYGGAKATPAISWGWGGSGASVSAKIATYQGTKTLRFTATNCDALIAAPAVNTRNYVYEITFIHNKSGQYIGISNQTWGTDTLSSSQWLAVKDNDAPYYKYKGTDNSGGIGTTTTTDEYRATIGEEVTMKLVSYNGVNYYFIDGRYVTSVKHLGSLGTNETTDRPGLYTYNGDAYIKSIYVNEISVAEEVAPEGYGVVDGKYYLEGDVIYDPDFSEFTVDTLPEGWSYGHPNGTGETKTSFGWAANTSATASAKVVNNATYGNVVQFSSVNTDAFMAIPATNTMNYIYDATVIVNTSGNSIGHANNFYGATNAANGAMYNCIYPHNTNDKASCKYRNGGSTVEWDVQYSPTNGEKLNLRIISLDGNNYIFYNGTHTATAPWRTGGASATSDNPGFYTYNGNMLVTDVTVTAIHSISSYMESVDLGVAEDKTVDMTAVGSFSKDQYAYGKFYDSDYAYAEDAELKFGMVVISGDEKDSELAVDTDGAMVFDITDSGITQDSEKVYFSASFDVDPANYTKYYTVRPFTLVDDIYCYGDAVAYTPANLSNSAYVNGNDTVKANVKEVFGGYSEFLFGDEVKNVTFTLLADFHYKAGMYSTSMADLRQILDRADKTNSNFIMSAGDMCNDLKGSPELTNTYLNYVTEEGSVLPAYNIYGNHELESANNSMEFVTPRLTNGKNVVWGTADGKIAEDGSIGYYYFEENGFRIVCLDNNYNWNPNHIDGVEVGWEHYLTASYGATSAKTNAGRGFDEGAAALACTKSGSLGDVQMAWLEKVLLDAADKDMPCIVVAHAGYSGLGFGGGSGDAEEVRAVYAKANAANPGTVVMSINGHIHTNNQGWNEGVFYLDMNTVRNNWWQGTAVSHYGAEHTYMYEEYDSEGNLLSVTEKSLSTLSAAGNTWFSEDPLSAVVTVSDNGIVTIDGMESDWAYGIVPSSANPEAGVECKVTSGTFWNCGDYGHYNTYVDDGDTHHIACDNPLCDYVQAGSEETHSYTEVVNDKFLASSATCIAQATYYKSCVCGKTSDETFAYGDLAKHDFENGTCTECKRVIGDMNNDGVFDVTDLVAVVRVALELDAYDVFADVDENGTVDFADATALRKKLLG